MKVNIDNYTSYWGPYQVADLLKHFGVSEDRCCDIGDKLVETWFGKFLIWIDSKKKRKVKVKIHDYDTFSIDTTMAYIMLPLLKRFQATKMSNALVMDEDVPENLRSYNAPPTKYSYQWDGLSSKRWDWVLDEMIWAFEQVHVDNDWEAEYVSGNVPLEFTPAEYDEEFNVSFKEPEVREFNKLPAIDTKKYKEYNDRIDNGLLLFGKYFRSLWD